jgi:hypothetical protein
VSNREEAERAVEGPAAILAELGLQTKDADTRIVQLREGGEGFDFLGFHRRCSAMLAAALAVGGERRRGEGTYGLADYGACPWPPEDVE